MFQQFKSIDSAFKLVRLFCALFLIASFSISVFVIYRTTNTLQKGQNRVYVLYNGQLLEATGIERSDSVLAIEIRSHIKTFHQNFYTLAPDELANKRHLAAAFYLADNTARQEYNNLVESGYYNNIISANITQEVLEPDSIRVDLNRRPYAFRYYGKLHLTRPTSILTRVLITEGTIRMITIGISDHNPHGMLIENWHVIDNHDLNFEKR